MPQNKRRRAFSKTPEPSNKENEISANECVANHKGEWDTPTRSRVKALFEVGWTRSAIKKATKVPARSQRKIQSGPDRRPGKKRSGAPKKLSQRDLRTIIRYLTKSFETRQSTWQQLAYDYGHGCHPDTVKHALNREGYYKCKACQMTFLTNDNVANRLAFAKAHKQRSFGFWKSVRFTDETHFSMESRATAWVIRDDTERYHPTCVQYKKKNKGSQLHAWAMVGWGYKGPLIFFDSNDTSGSTEWIYQAIATESDTPQPAKETQDEEADLLGIGRPSTCRHRCKNKSDCKHDCCKAGYRNPKLAGNMIMEQYLTKIFRPYIENAWQEAKDKHQSFILLEDNDGSHGTKTSTNIVARYKAKIGIPWYANSPRSPDLNIIENVWRILKQRLKQALRSSKGLDIEGVKSLILDLWDGIDIEDINTLVSSMPHRIDECLRRKGMNTPF
jgi:hypothetical protein